MQNWKVLEPTCFYKFTKFCQILILSLWFLTLPYFLATIAQILQKVIVFFPGKVRGDRALILTCLNSPIANVFPHYCLYFFISTIFRGKRMVKVWPKVQTLGTSLFHEFFNFFSNNVFSLLECYLWWECRQYCTIFGGVRTQKPPKKNHFMDAESVRKTLKTFNLATSNAIMMKLTAMIYLHEIVNRKSLRVKNSVLA